jgi:hypothetical protein
MKRRDGRSLCNYFAYASTSLYLPSRLYFPDWEYIQINLPWAWDLFLLMRKKLGRGPVIFKWSARSRWTVAVGCDRQTVSHTYIHIWYITQCSWWSILRLYLIEKFGGNRQRGATVKLRSHLEPLSNTTMIRIAFELRPSRTKIGSHLKAL